jgi:hypothetical protein
LEGEGFEAGVAQGAEVVQGGGVVELEEAGGEFFGGVGVEVEGGVGGDLREAAGGGAEDGAAEAHGFQDGKAEALVEAGKDEGGGTGVETLELGVVDLAGEADAVAEGVGLAEDGCVAGAEAAKAAREDKAVGDSVLHFREGAQEEREVFVRLYVADEEEVGGAAVFNVGWGGVRPGGVEAEVGDGRFGEGDVEAAGELVAGEGGDAEDGVGLFYGAGDEEPGVGALEGVVEDLREGERGDVVDGDGQGAAAVEGGVEVWDPEEVGAGDGAEEALLGEGVDGGGGLEEADAGVG